MPQIDNTTNQIVSNTGMAVFFHREDLKRSIDVGLNAFNLQADVVDDRPVFLADGAHLEPLPKPLLGQLDRGAATDGLPAYEGSRRTAASNTSKALPSSNRRTKTTPSASA